MRKIVLFVLAFIILCPLYSSITFPSDMADGDISYLLDTFSSAISGRKDVSINVISFNRNEDAGLTLTFTLENQERSISARDESEMRRFIQNALSLEPLLFLDESTLYYVSRDIIASSDEWPKGTLVEVFDAHGEKRALLEVIGNVNGSSVYSPIYQNNLVAGLALRKGPSFSLSLRALSNFSFNSFSFAIDCAYLPLWQYFNPFISLYINYDGALSYYGGLGLEVRFPLERLIRVRFTLIEDAALFATATAYLGYDRGFSYGAGFSVGYEHHISARFKWRVGWETSTIVSNTLSLSFGVLI